MIPLLQSVIPALTGLIATALGLAVGASRRNRLISRVRAYNGLAAEVEPRNPTAARALDEVASELVDRLTVTERKALRRTFEPAYVLALALLLVPAGIASYFAWTNSGWWTWPVIVLSILWTMLWVMGSWGQFWTEHEAATDQAQ